MRILVVEDELELAETIAEGLRLGGYSGSFHILRIWRASGQLYNYHAGRCQQPYHSSVFHYISFFIIISTPF